MSRTLGINSGAYIWFLITLKLHFPFSRTKVRRLQKGQFFDLNINKKGEYLMWPFGKNKNAQRGWSITFIILGLLIMVVKPLSAIINNIGLNSFITGLIIAFVGFFYFMDIQ